jgi:hypothetical protein
MMRPDAKVEKVYLYPKPVELLADYLALKAHIGFLPCVVYGSLTPAMRANCSETARLKESKRSMNPTFKAAT